MYPGFTGTRTVKTFYSDGSGPPRVETYTYGPGAGGGSGGLNIGFTPEVAGGGGGGAGTHVFPPPSFSSDFDTRLGFGGERFGGGGQGINIRLGGGGGGAGAYDDRGGSGFGFRTGVGAGGGSSAPEPRDYGRAQPPPRPKAPPRLSAVGRPQRSVQKNPFAGLKEQKYSEIRAKCLQEGILFQDPEFPTAEDSAAYSRRSGRRLEWRRPPEICSDPEWISAGASRFDVRQGELGDCWLLAAVASLTCNQKLFSKVVPPDQNFSQGYCGVFRFNFWHQGDWTEVVVDDRLPTYNGQLVFMHSTEKNEFWSALLEKAYAKMMGSYESLKGGSTSEAMEDFTGGVTEMFELRGKQPPNLLKILLKAFERGSLMGCSIDADPGRFEAQLANGLIMGHAYSITAVRLLDLKTPRVQGKIPLVRVRNPWGNECEWKGPWSDQSREWSMVSERQKHELGLKKDDDGEFWMSFQDFTQEFQKLEICNLSPDSLDEMDLSNKKRWDVHKEHSSWVKRVSAGGCRNFLDTFWINPQFRMTLSDIDDDDDDDMCTAIIAVLQKDRRKKRKEGIDLLTIGYAVYKLDVVQAGPLDLDYFKYNASVAKSPTFINMREVCGRHKLPPGTYCIVPSTFDPHQEGEFLIRIFTEKPNTSGGIDQETSFSDVNKPEPTRQERQQEDGLMDNFRRIAGEDLEVDAVELKRMLDTFFRQEVNFQGFNIEAARSMVAMYDGDMSGKLGYEEFKELLEDLRHWKGVFKQFDRNLSGNLTSYELRTALSSTGFRLSNRTLQSLVMRYSNSDGQIDFSDFITCTVRLKTMINTFRALDKASQGIAPVDMETFLQTTMYS
ncbi:calpain-9-like isoform X2 [Babylonia areolata]|uniref:calpain-9-like isoform X2 n=1 Tax=Babylonia areolata TaxID=304850 RepID=UPI003FCF2700